MICLLNCSVFLTFFVSASPDFFKINNNCKLKDDFWRIYDDYLKMSSVLQFNTIQISSGEEFKVNDGIKGFSDQIIQRFSKGKTVFSNKETIDATNVIKNDISAKNVGKIKRKMKRSEYNLLNSSFSEISYEKKRLRSSDPYLAYIVIVWNFSMFEEVFKNYKNIKDRYREIFVLFFIDEEFDENGVSMFLEMFWKSFHVLNVVAQAPCSSKYSDYVYVYHPFYLRKNKSYGVTKRHQTKSVLLNPLSIINFLENLNGYPINVSMFEREPTSVSRSGEFAGIDGSFVYYLGSKLNASLRIKVADHKSFGTVKPDGTVTGTLSEVTERHCELAGNNRFVKNYGTDLIEFTNPIYTEKICPVVPKAEAIPSSLALFKCFPPMSWLVILLTILLLMVLRYVFERVHGCFPKSEKPRSSAMLYMFGTLIGVPTKQPKKLYSFMSACLVFTLIILGVFEGTMVKSYSVTSYYKDMDTLEELVESDLPISTSLDVLDYDDDNVIRKLKRKKIRSVPDGLNYLLKHRNISALERERDMDFYMKMYFTNSDGMPEVHYMGDCVMTYWVAYILPKGSTYLNAINYYLSELIENGLMNDWYGREINRLVIKKIFGRASSAKKNNHAFSLGDLQVAFYILMAGLTIATVCFCCELFCYPIIN